MYSFLFIRLSSTNCLCEVPVLPPAEGIISSVYVMHNALFEKQDRSGTKKEGARKELPIKEK